MLHSRGQSLQAEFPYGYVRNQPTPSEKVVPNPVNTEAVRELCPGIGVGSNGQACLFFTHAPGSRKTDKVADQPITPQCSGEPTECRMGAERLELNRKRLSAGRGT